MLLFRRYFTLALLSAMVFIPAGAQTLDKNQRDRGVQMLRDVADAMRKHYYDPSFHGIDLAARLKTAEEAIQNAKSNSQIFGAIAEVLVEMNDSHLFFEPPARNTHREFGYVMEMVGDACYVTNVRPHTDAEQKLSPGDRILSIQGNVPTRANLWNLRYAVNDLYALTVLRMQIARPDGTEKTVDVNAKIRQDKRVLDLTSDNDYYQLVREEDNAEHLARHRQAEFGEMLGIWKLPAFDLNDGEVDKAMKFVKKHPAIVMDLRGNGGGAVSMLQYLVSAFMDHDVTIAARKGRKDDLKPIVAKKRGGTYTGKVIVLVDSRSASASELFARMIQLEHRGVVLGDLSSGSVMESRFYSMSEGADRKIFYGASVTDADLTMTDGKSLEHLGVTPDELILPTPEDLAAGRDPVLAKAAKLAGIELDPVAAGKLFPYEWRQN